MARLAADSQCLRDRVRWFTSLLGKKRSIAPLSRLLHAMGAATVEVALPCNRWTGSGPFIGLEGCCYCSIPGSHADARPDKPLGAGVVV